MIAATTSGKRGRKPGGGKTQERILAALRAAGTETDGRPRALRAADLAARAGVSHHNMHRHTAGMLEAGLIVRCKVQMPRGAPTYEYRLGSCVPAAAHKPLDPRRHGVASAPPGKPLPTTTRASAASDATDAAMLARVQAMSEAEFGDYVAHLARVWAYGRARRAAA